LNGISITNGYDALLRRTNIVTLLSGTVLTMITNNFDAASRFSIISDRTNSATYGYLANSPLVQQITLKRSGTTRMTTAKAYDYLNRLTGITNANASSLTLDSRSYAYNSANQRTAVTNTDNSRWNYTYDALGQVTAGTISGATAQSWRDAVWYGFDDIGNRTSAAFGGDTNRGNLRSGSYTVNNLNEYTSRVVPGTWRRMVRRRTRRR